jgi:hypothetical protein
VGLIIIWHPPPPQQQVKEGRQKVHDSLKPGALLSNKQSCQLQTIPREKKAVSAVSVDSPAISHS